MAKRFTLKTAKSTCANYGFSLKKTGEGDEIRVAPVGVSRTTAEDRAYYTGDLADAVGACRVSGQWERKHGGRASTKVFGARKAKRPVTRAGVRLYCVGKFKTKKAQNNCQRRLRRAVRERRRR